MSLKKICSCRFFVPVETSTRSPFRMAGTRYASVLPVPVPASASSTPPRSNASATAAAISIWPARGSKSATAPVSGPPSANAALAASTRLQDCRIAELREGSNEPLRSFLPSCNSAILQFCNLRVGIQRESAAQSLHLGADHGEGPVVLGCLQRARDEDTRSEEHTSELQSHSFISYAVFCLKTNTNSPASFAIRYRRPGQRAVPCLHCR